MNAPDGTAPAPLGDHYFTAQPASADERRLITVQLAGRELEVEVAPGVFSPHRIDLGTSVLLKQAPTPPPTGNLLDLGCGWGPLALTMALESPAATVWAVDVNERARDLVRRNADRLGLANVVTCAPHEVLDHLTFDALWSNPTIRIGKEALHLMMQQWLPRLTASTLTDGCGAWMVVQKNLGSDSLARWISEHLGDQGISVTRKASSKGFRILHVTRQSQA